MTYQLYRWKSEALKNYRQGDILAIGETVDEARAHARARFEETIRDNWEGLYPEAWGEESDDHDLAERAERMAELEADIMEEPSVQTAVFISGGE